MTISPAPKVLVVLRRNRTIPPGLLEKAGNLANFVYVVDRSEVRSDDRDVSIAFVWDFRSRLVPEMIDRLPSLRWVHVAAVGVDASLSTKVAERGVIVTNSRGVTAQAMAEYALGMMLYFAKGIRTTLTDQGARRWRPRNTKNLAGACLVLVGVGAVNQRLAVMASAIGMRVIGVARSSRTPYAPLEAIVGFRHLRDVLPQADYVVVATPLTSETRGLIGVREFATMKPGAVFLNIGRGDVVDEQGLIRALESQRLGGIGLDVVWREPLEPTHPLWTSPNVLLSPHMSSDAEGWEEGMVDAFIENLRRWLNGKPLQNQVDKSLGYVPSDAWMSRGTSE